MSYPTVPGAPPPPYRIPEPEPIARPGGTAGEPAGTRARADHGSGRRNEPPVRFPPPRPYDPEGRDAEQHRAAAAQLVAARLSRAIGRGEPVIPHGPQDIVPVLEEQFGFDHRAARDVAQQVWSTSVDAWTAAEDAVVNAAQITRRLAAAEAQPPQQAPPAGRAHVQASQPSQDTPPPAAQAVEAASAAAPGEPPRPYQTLGEASAQQDRIYGLHGAALLNLARADMDTQARRADSFQQLADLYVSPTDRPGAATDPRATAAHFQQIRDTAHRMTQHIEADLTGGLLVGRRAERAQLAQRELQVLARDAQTHVARLRATTGQPSARPFSRRGRAEHAAGEIAAAYTAWAATPLGDAVLTGRTAAARRDIDDVRHAWDQVNRFGNGVPDAAAAAPRYEELARSLYRMEDMLLWSDNAPAARAAGGDQTRLLHEAADRAMAVSKRLEVSGRRGERGGWGVASRLTDRTAGVLNRVTGSGMRDDTARAGTGDARAGDAGQTRAAEHRGMAARLTGRLSRREGHAR